MQQLCFLYFATLFIPSGEEEVRGEVGGPASGKTEPRSLGAIGEPPSDIWSFLWPLGHFAPVCMAPNPDVLNQAVHRSKCGGFANYESRFNGEEPPHQSSQRVPHNHQSEGKQIRFQAKRLF